MDTNWSRNLGQREDIVADTGSGRVQRSSRTNTAPRQINDVWKVCGVDSGTSSSAPVGIFVEYGTLRPTIIRRRYVLAYSH
ncbi:hypothetical protein BLNAU_3309 [Blattamonas nauphoetae]|uniref:Uncharacterized protein n=1 Tax=Blattamonas nauphoetae TaxID=2049346 RepID=A0ABQ9YDM5_9EUKA|nr:hypothetical protein BLNAU_3309 [Blattamonas nauphoetae]